MFATELICICIVLVLFYLAIPGTNGANKHLLETLLCLHKLFSAVVPVKLTLDKYIIKDLEQKKIDSILDMRAHEDSVENTPCSNVDDLLNS